VRFQDKVVVITGGSSGIVAVNLKGVFFSFARALPLFYPGASVVFTATATHARGRPGDPLYLASKAAVRNLARSLAADDEVLRKRIRVNFVSPGAVETPLTARARLGRGACLRRRDGPARPLGGRPRMWRRRCCSWRRMKRPT
jgi:NAD(P)-dependent dehydrogenase (short-subunit alcohol dehydrogenase family)